MDWLSCHPVLQAVYRALAPLTVSINWLKIWIKPI